MLRRMTENFIRPQNDNCDYQITDLLQLSRKEHESRIHCRRTLRQFGDWKKTHVSHVHPAVMFHSRIEGILLKRQVQDAILFYRLVKKDRMRAFQDYMGRLPSGNAACGVSQCLST